MTLETQNNTSGYDFDWSCESDMSCHWPAVTITIVIAAPHFTHTHIHTLLSYQPCLVLQCIIRTRGSPSRYSTAAGRQVQRGAARCQLRRPAPRRHRGWGDRGSRGVAAEFDVGDELTR